SDPRYVNACAYARLALCVWEARPADFVKYHRWLMAGPRAPALDEARRRAAEIVGGAEALDAALVAPRVQQQLADALSIFRLTNTGPLPRLLLPSGILWGSGGSAEKLVSLLRRELASPSPVPAAKGIFSADRID